MKATDELKKEHEGIKLMLRILGAVADRIEEGTPVPPEDLDAIAEFLSVFADKCHHGKEENHLFPVLEAVGVLREGGPIGVMLQEHAKGRALIAGLKDAVAGYKLKKKDAPGRFVANARQYIELLTQHIEKENGVLFMMADAKLDPGRDDALLEAFEELEHDRIGPGKHEEFHALLERLKKAYLG